MHKQQTFALVTGCGRGGIGEALVKEYTRRGVCAIATVLPTESSEHLTEAGITWLPLDVTSEESIVDLKMKLQALTGGRLGILVNNAGICKKTQSGRYETILISVISGYTMTAIDTDVSSVKRMFDVNLFGPMQMVHHLHDMIIRAAGAVVNIGSIGGVVPYMYGASYNASKAALHHWSNTLRLEMSPFNVRVITVISGEVGTNILKSDVHRELPIGSYYSPLAAEFKHHVQRTPKTADRFKYAELVVAQSLRPSPLAWFWCGSNTAIVRFFDTFAWRTFWDLVFWQDFNLAKLRAEYLSRVKQE